jgi:hypothetical protein
LPPQKDGKIQNRNFKKEENGFCADLLKEFDILN